MCLLVKSGGSKCCRIQVNRRLDVVDKVFKQLQAHIESVLLCDKAYSQGCIARSTSEALMHLLLQRCTAPHQAHPVEGTVQWSETVLQYCQQAQGRRLCAGARKVLLVFCKNVHFNQPHAEILCQVSVATLLTLAAHKQPPQKVQHWRSVHSAVRSQGSCEVLVSFQAYSLCCILCTGA